MSVGLSLLLYAALLSLLGPRLLTDRGATRLSPRLGVTAWFVAAWSTVLATVLGGLILAIPELPHSVDQAIVACTHALPEHAEAISGTSVRAGGLVLAAAIAARATWSVAATLVTGFRLRRRHQETLRMVGRPSVRPGAVVLESDLALVYCLPGRRKQVVLTSGALRALSRSEVDAAVAHEHAHLRGRHHLSLALLHGLSRAYPSVPLFQYAVREVGRLLEMRADDVAAARHGRRAVVAALTALSDAPTPAGSLAAAETAVEERLRRLMKPLGQARCRRAALAIGVFFLLAGPLIAASVPLAAELVHHFLFCPPPAA